MILAVTYDNENVFQHFGHTKQFKIYTIENNSIKESKIVDTNGKGHGELATFLKEQNVDSLICGGIGGGAKTALSQNNIKLFPGVTGNADIAVNNLLNGSLVYNPNTECTHHKGEHKCSH